MQRRGQAGVVYLVSRALRRPDDWDKQRGFSHVFQFHTIQMFHHHGQGEAGAEKLLCMENTILFGNGLNRLNGKNPSWENMLEKVAKRELVKGISNTLQYEDIYLSGEVKPVIGDKYNDTTEYWLKKEIADSLSNYEK